MSSKKRKESQSWFVCENCKIIIVHKSLKIHNQNSCPPNYEEWIHPFLLNDTLYSNIDIYSNIGKPRTIAFINKLQQICTNIFFFCQQKKVYNFFPKSVLMISFLFLIKFFNYGKFQLEARL